MRILKNLLTATISLILFFGGLELGFRTFASERNRTYFEEQTERGLGTPVPQKEPGEYRIFVFGGSAAYGFPVADRYSITAWLRKSFPLLLPGRKVRVVNCGWPGKGSHHVVEGVRNITKYQPDLLIIYSGHNDFPTANRLYADNWLYRLNLHLIFRSTFYRFLDNRMNRVRKKIVYGKSGYPEKYYREEIIAKKFYKKVGVNDEEDKQIFRRHFLNLEDVIRWAKGKGVDVLFLSLASNVHEIPPAASTNSPRLSLEGRTRWDQWFQGGQVHQREKHFAEALRAYQEAAKIDPTYADLQYRLGIDYEATGDYEAAKKAYLLARDYDRSPTRAKSRMNENIRELTKKYGLIFVDVVSSFEKLSPHGIITGDLIYDDVHPSIKAQQIIVDEILHALAEKGKIAPSTEWRWQALETAREDPAQNGEWKIDGHLNAYRYLLRGLHLWGQGDYADCVVDLEKGLELMPKLIEMYAFLGDAYTHLQEKGRAAKAFQALTEQDAALSKLLRNKYPEIQESYVQTMKAVRN